MTNFNLTPEAVSRIVRQAKLINPGYKIVEIRVCEDYFNVLGVKDDSRLTCVAMLTRDRLMDYTKTPDFDSSSQFSPIVAYIFLKDETMSNIELA